MYRYLLRPVLFLFPAETAHHIAMTALSFMIRIPGGKGLIRLLFGAHPQRHRQSILGLDFPNRLGIAAGFDKNGSYVAALAALGFGHIEIGTVTPRPQHGNPRPRLFRLHRSHALINRMGFNNKGCLTVSHHLENYRNRDFILGANIGKNKDTPNENAVDDYLLCFDTLHPHVDYFVVNVSSPNTPGLRELQDREPLTRILEAILQRNSELDQRKPVLLKIAPDLTDGQLRDIIEMSNELSLDGIVVSNTTIARSGLLESPAFISKIGNGGLSGVPLQQKSHTMLQQLRAALPEAMTLIGVGGIDSGESAQARLDAGASLVQVYTGFIYKGPSLVSEIVGRTG
jgi:dihydroorotate dehydrogenase